MMSSNSKAPQSSSTSNPSKPETNGPILVVGLGNPGASYEQTRHNVGFLATDALAKHLGATFAHKAKLHADIAQVNVNGRTWLLAKPTTFMNRSGDAVSAITSWQKTATLYVIHDEVDLPFGEVRMKTSGGSAGHNGIKSLIAHLGTDQFTRVRMGVGRPANEQIPLEDWVLGKWSQEEKEALPEFINQALASLPL